MNKLLIPNTCQVPNVLLDKVISTLSGSAFKVLMVIVRKTYGFHKRADKISFRQLMDLTGLSRPAVNNGIKELGELILIQKGAVGVRYLEGISEYALNFDVETGSLVNKVNRLKNFTSKEIDDSQVTKVNSTKHNSTKPKGRSKAVPTKQPNPDSREFIAHWCDRYRKQFTEPYTILGKDAGQVARLLKTYGLARLKELADTFLATADRWVQTQGGFTIGVFASQINKLVSTSKREAYRPELREMPP